MSARSGNYTYSDAWPWPSYRCSRCGSVMLYNEAWEEHMRSHARLDAEAAAESVGPQPAAGSSDKATE